MGRTISPHCSLHCKRSLIDCVLMSFVALWQAQKSVHQHTFDAVSQWLTHPQTSGVFGYVTLMEAHEASMTIAAAMDNDLVGLLQKLLKARDDLIIVLKSDHGTARVSFDCVILISCVTGLHMGLYYELTHAGHVEQGEPALWIILPRSLLSKHQSVQEILQTNQNRLVSPLDLYHTYTHMLHPDFPLGGAELAREYPVSPIHMSSYDLFSEKLPMNRDCNNAGIPPERCHSENPKGMLPAA